MTDLKIIMLFCWLVRNSGLWMCLASYCHREHEKGIGFRWNLSVINWSRLTLMMKLHKQLKDVFRINLNTFVGENIFHKFN